MDTRAETLEWKVAPETTDDVSQWLVELGEIWRASKEKRWQFVRKLQEGLDELSKRQSRTELLDLAYNQTGLSPKTLSNYASIARKPSSAYAEKLGLDIAHADAVRAQPLDEAKALLLQAAEQSLPDDALRAILRERRQAKTANAGNSKDIPDAGNERRYIPADEYNPDESPFANKSSVLYQDDDYSAEASAYAGSAGGYDWADDDDGVLLLGRNDARDLIERAWRRLPADDTQRSIREWLMLLENNAY